MKKLVAHRHNGLIKIITGIRRCGKSFLLFNLFKEQLLSGGVQRSHIIEIELDDRRFKELRDPDNCLKYVTSLLDDNEMYYLLIDEVQYMKEFEDVLNSFLHMKNLDVYVTGSNSKFLSTDIITEFRGRGDEIRVMPLSFAEFYAICPDKPWDEAWKKYNTYGGLPYTALLDDDDEKAEYLKQLCELVYIKDIVERNHVANSAQLEDLLNIISSCVGSLTNPQKIADTFASSGMKLSTPTIKQYLDYFTDAFLVEKAVRYDIKGRKYISTPHKYYFTDIGLRNARLNFRQQEENHIMENIVFNELRLRGYSVDVGVVELSERGKNGEKTRKKTEIDFVINKGSRRYYVQSAFAMSTDEKREQEKRPLENVRDSFKKIVVVKDNVTTSRDDNGITTIGLKDFLLDPNSLDL